MPQSAELRVQDATQRGLAPVSMISLRTFYLRTRCSKSYLTLSTSGRENGSERRGSQILEFAGLSPAAVPCIIAEASTVPKR